MVHAQVLFDPNYEVAVIQAPGQHETGHGVRDEAAATDFAFSHGFELSGGWDCRHSPQSWAGWFRAPLLPRVDAPACCAAA